MKVEKKVISNLNKCYSITDITVEGKPCFLVAAEKKDPCYLFSESGELLETVWTEPGGIMTMTPVPGTDGQFLSTHEFFSPNDSLNARIVLVTRKEKNVWERKTICYAPFVHRFGILKRGGVNYIIVCCLKTGHEFKNDWRFPGACFGAELPKDLSALDEDHPLELKLIKGGMLQNHGFAKFSHGGHDAALVGCEQGSFIFDPPAVRGADWTVTRASSAPSTATPSPSGIWTSSATMCRSGSLPARKRTPRCCTPPGPARCWARRPGSSAGERAPRTPSPSPGTRKRATIMWNTSIRTPAAPTQCTL